MLATLGRLCFRRRRIVAGLWLLLLVVGIGGGSQVFGRLSDAGGSPSTESARGGRLLDAASTVGDRVLGLVDGVPVDDPRLSVAVPAAAADLRALPGVARVADWYGTRAARLRATDGRATLVVVDLRKDVGDADERRVVAAVRDRLATLARQVPGATTRVGGEAVVYEEINKQAKADTTRAEVVALPVTLVLMIVVFGGVVAASLPFLGAVASVAGTLLALLGISTALTLDPNVVSVASGLGLGLSVDYCLLMVNRYREERGAGHCAEEAVVRTVRTAGRTILFSALTVAVCVAALFAFDNRVYRAIGAAGVSVVLVALAAALTLLPALLGLFGGRIKVPARPVGDDGAFARLARRVQRRALPVALVVGALLLAAAGPFLGVRFRDGGAATLPTSFDSRQVADVVAARFPGAKADPIRVVAPVPQAQLADYARTLSGLPGVASVRVDPDLSGSDPSGPVSAVEVVPRGETQGAQAQRLVDLLRERRPPFPSYVTGGAAFLVDFRAAISSRLPWALGGIVLATFVLLFLMTGSVLVPLKALVMNVLSLGASFGALVLVFQDGHLASLVGVTPAGAIETWTPVIVFVFAFGLSMDYEVFLLARVKELYGEGRPNDEAVAVGLQRSGRIITSAAGLIVVVFGAFAAGELLGIKQMGFALALAVAVDATLVRCLLVPATMTLLGEANWWAPAPLRRLHARFGLREAAPEPAGPGPAPPPPAGPHPVPAGSGEAVGTGAVRLGPAHRPRGPRRHATRDGSLTATTRRPRV